MKLPVIKKTAPKSVILHLGDCLNVLNGLPDNSVDSIVTDPPYGLKFMAKKWDYDVPSVEVWSECLRVLKPGGYLLSFAGTRTQHRMAVRIEDAGFEIRDMIAWVYGSGFPKSLDVSKALDEKAGAVREVVGVRDDKGRVSTFGGGETRPSLETAPATEAAKKWEGWGTALKPALEPITLARKPLIGTVAENVLAHGTGGINVDGCRVPIDPAADASQLRTMSRGQRTEDLNGQKWGMSKAGGDATQVVKAEGRWPANLIHDGSEEVTRLFPSPHGAGAARTAIRECAPSGNLWKMAGDGHRFGDSGSAARFFYCAKASKADRNDGLDAFLEKSATEILNRKEGTAGIDNPRAGAGRGGAKNFHPTVKPTELMRYLCRLVTPPGGIVLDPFMGSGSTGKAARIEGFRFIGIEREKEYLDIATVRIGA